MHLSAGSDLVRCFFWVERTQIVLKSDQQDCQIKLKLRLSRVEVLLGCIREDHVLGSRVRPVGRLISLDSIPAQGSTETDVKQHMDMASE